MPCIRDTPNLWPVGIVSSMNDLSLPSITKVEQEWHVLCATYFMAAAVLVLLCYLVLGKKDPDDHENS